MHSSSQRPRVGWGMNGAIRLVHPSRLRHRTSSHSSCRCLIDVQAVVTDHWTTSSRQHPSLRGSPGHENHSACDTLTCVLCDVPTHCTVPCMGLCSGVHEGTTVMKRRPGLPNSPLALYACVGRIFRGTAVLSPARDKLRVVSPLSLFMLTSVQPSASALSALHWPVWIE